MNHASNTSVIICAHTEARWDDLVVAIASVQAQTPPPLETIVVIDHNPRLFERVNALAFGVFCIENSETRGLSGARNSGIAAANGEVIAFLDDDAVAGPHWLERLTTPYSDPNVMGVGGAILPMWAEGKPAWFPTEFNWVVGCTYTGMPAATSPVRNLIGCNMSFRREVFEAVGGFRSELGRLGKYPAGCEETELCIRASQRWPDRVMLYEPRAAVMHRVPASRANMAYFRTRCYAEGLSKALVARQVGAQDGLASERAYTLRTLPLGVAAGLGNTIKGDFAGLGRSAAIVAGLAFTSAGYMMGIARQKFTKNANKECIKGARRTHSAAKRVTL